MVFTRPHLSERIPKMIPPVAQPRIIQVVAVIRPLLIASGVAPGPSRDAIADSRERANSRWSMQSNSQPREAMITTIQ